MIINFGNRETEKIWKGTFSSKLPNEIQKTARRKLRMIHNSQSLNDLKAPPANQLEKLKRELSDYHSIRINRQWRIIFIWRKPNAHDVSIVDYH